mgnify:CR=1 FL=1
MNLENSKKIMLSIILISIILILFIIYMLNTNSNDEIFLESLTVGGNTAESNVVENLEAEEELETEKIAIHIIGEVKKEGIVYLEAGSRIVDAIKEAGGATKEADLSQINLAYELQDGQKIYIPNKNEKISEYITMSSGNNVIIEENNSSAETERKENKVNINTANVNELDNLPGIGPSLAQRIIEYREENGNFKSIEELQNVKGIGDAKYSDIKDNVTI